jgi:hypothetical protein
MISIVVFLKLFLQKQNEHLFFAIDLNISYYIQLNYFDSAISWSYILSFLGVIADRIALLYPIKIKHRGNLDLKR